MHSDTLVKTRIKKKTALAIPWRVTESEKPKSRRLISGSPGLKISNNTGKTITRENNGIKIQVRLKKNPRLIDDRWARKRQKAYMAIRKDTFLASKTARSRNNTLKDLSLGSLACKNPAFAAYSSENIDSRKKENAPCNERSIKLFLLISFCLKASRSIKPCRQ
jgi:hypothetical protein